MTSKFAYLFVPEINFVDLKSPNDYERKIPQELMDLLDHQEERRAWLIMEKSPMINLNNEKDPRMV